MVYVYLANGFEEVEAISVIDILRRHEIELQTVGVNTISPVGMHGITVKADVLISDIFINKSTKMIVLPGGTGVSNLANSETVIQHINESNKNNIFIAAICAAPTILGAHGLLQKKKAVCFSGLENQLIGAVVCKDPVVVDGNIITAKNMEAAFLFSQTLAKLLSEFKP
ncbi:MAG: DJ-1/PfpI family protein [Oscillospiraceae bacterium]|jgi:4-methyl-5(b-hydroxyethyl)-thiazole monophosphate biosynthesis|nr:DJ-1/PfpI family protein [Oscillospiraceae bacterium]